MFKTPVTLSRLSINLWIMNILCYYCFLDFSFHQKMEAQLSHQRGSFLKSFIFIWSVSTPGKPTPFGQCSVMVTLHWAAHWVRGWFKWLVQGHTPIAEERPPPTLLFSCVAHCWQQPVPLKDSHQQFRGQHSSLIYTLWVENRDRFRFKDWQWQLLTAKMYSKQYPGKL